MLYQVSINRRAFKTLEQISEPYYSNIKAAIYSLANDPRPNGYKKLRGGMVTAYGWVIIGLSMIF